MSGIMEIPAGATDVNLVVIDIATPITGTVQNVLTISDLDI